MCKVCVYFSLFSDVRPWQFLGMSCELLLVMMTTTKWIENNILEEYMVHSEHFNVNILSEIENSDEHQLVNVGGKD